jgi:group II intron reverse transcriptase/maturase
MKSNPGNMTPGSDGKTLDGYSHPYSRRARRSRSEENIRKIIEEVRSGKFDFKPSRRIYIKKANGKMRPLGIPSPTDKVVQKVYLNLLEKVYEPIFLNTSHGFRPKRSCHTALKEIKKWTGCTWLIEGDIKGYFDNIDHHKLESLLEKQIKDRRLIHLYWKMVRAGYVENDGKERSSTLGVPQGSIISPILSNVYLHELDIYMEKLKMEYNTSSIGKDNPEYAKERHARAVQVKKGLTKSGDKITKEWLTQEKLRINKLPTKIRTGVRITYVIYADYFVIGIIG